MGHYDIDGGDARYKQMVNEGRKKSRDEQVHKLPKDVIEGDYYWVKLIDNTLPKQPDVIVPAVAYKPGRFYITGYDDYRFPSEVKVIRRIPKPRIKS